MVRGIQVIAIGLLFFAALYSFLSANFDQSELQDVAFVSAFAVDQVGDDLRVTVQVINPIRLKQGTSSQQSATLVYSALGKTLGDAVNRLFLQVPLEIKFNALQLILIQDKVVKKQKIIPIAQYFVRNHDISQSPPMVIVREGKAGDILQVFLPFNDIGSKSVVANMNKIRSKISDFQYYADDILYINDLPGKDVTLPAVKLSGDIKAGENPEQIPSSFPPSIVRMDGMALFKEGKLIGFISEDERRLLAYFYEIDSFTTIVSKCSKDNYATVKIAKNASKIFVSDWSKVDKPKVTIEINMSGFLDGYDCEAPIDQHKNLQRLEGDVEKKVRDNIHFLYEKSRVLHTDFLGIEAVLYRDNFKKWKMFHEKHSDPLQNMELEVHVNMEMNSLGDLKGSKRVEEDNGL